MRQGCSCGGLRVLWRRGATLRVLSGALSAPGYSRGSPGYSRSAHNVRKGHCMLLKVLKGHLTVLTEYSQGTRRARCCRVLKGHLTVLTGYSTGALLQATGWASRCGPSRRSQTSGRRARSARSSASAWQRRRCWYVPLALRWPLIPRITWPLFRRTHTTILETPYHYSGSTAPRYLGAAGAAAGAKNRY